MKPKCSIDNKIKKEVSVTTKLLKVIAEENRLKILCSLKKEGERCACDIGEDLEVPQNLSSHHLKVLKDAGLVDSRKEGLRVIYSINKREMNKFNLLLSNYLKKYE